MKYVIRYLCRYVDTPTYAGHDKDPARQKAAATKARKAEEEAVVKLAKRAEAESSTVPPAAEDAGAAKGSATNPYLAMPVLEEEARWVFGASVLRRIQLGLDGKVAWHF